MSSTTQAPGTSAAGHVDPAAAFVPVQTRSERPHSFDPADFGVPTGREVNWKHTPIDRIAALVRTAIGFDTKRGDQLEVVNLRFADPQAPAARSLVLVTRFQSATRRPTRRVPRPHST